MSVKNPYIVNFKDKFYKKQINIFIVINNTKTAYNGYILIANL